MKFIETKKPGVMRDMNSKGLVFCNSEERRAYRAALQERAKVNEEINSIKEKMEHLSSELSEIKFFMSKISEKLS